MSGIAFRFQTRAAHLAMAFSAMTFVGALLLLAPPAVAIEEGRPAPAFELPALSGDGTLSLSDYQGKVVYLDFWASWCAPCVSAMPFLEELRSEFPSARFQVLAVNLDKDPKKGQKFMRKFGVKYPSASDPKGRLPKSFDLQTMPTSYLIDGKGVVRYVHKGFRGKDEEAIRAEIAKLVGGR
jgi:thiol-disulfide isomerase/thioredoxin